MGSHGSWNRFAQERREAKAQELNNDAGCFRGTQMAQLPIEVCRPSSYQLERCLQVQHKRDQTELLSAQVGVRWRTTHVAAVHVCGQSEADHITRNRSSQKFAQLVLHWQSFRVSTLQGIRHANVLDHSSVSTLAPLPMQDHCSVSISSLLASLEPQAVSARESLFQTTACKVRRRSQKFIPQDATQSTNRAAPQPLTL